MKTNVFQYLEDRQFANFGILTIQALVVLFLIGAEIYLANALLPNILFVLLFVVAPLVVLYSDFQANSVLKELDNKSGFQPTYGTTYYFQYQRIKSLLNAIVFQTNSHIKIELLIFDSRNHADEDEDNSSISAFQIKNINYIMVPSRLFAFEDSMFKASFAHEIGHLLSNHSNQYYLRSHLETFLQFYHPFILGILLSFYLSVWYLGPILCLIFLNIAQISIFAHSKQRENTADGVSALLGYGEDLKFLLINYGIDSLNPSIFERIVNLKLPHPLLKTRISNINSLMKK